MTAMKLDRIRTRLRDVVFGRTKIRVVRMATSDDVVPVFVLGTFRSGTTLLRYLLDSHSEICCPPETKFMVHLANLHHDSTTRNALASMGLEEQHVRRSLREFATLLYRPYMLAKGKRILVDKTPEYVRLVKFIDWLYEGKCRYLLIFRNGLDVTNSLMSTTIEPLEATKTIDTAFDYWKNDTTTMLEWMEARKPACHKLLYENLCEDVVGVMKDVFRFLGVQWEEEVLKWYQKEHDIGFEDIKARRLRRVRQSRNTYVSWDAETVQRLKDAAHDIHAALGYEPQSLNPR